MAIAMECFNTIVRKSVIAEKYPGGLAQCKEDCGATFIEDEYLIRGGAMNWFDVERGIRHFEKFGIRYLDENGRAVDIVVVDMIRGPTTPCDWIEFDTGVEGPRCWLRGTSPGALSKPNRPNPEDDVFFAFNKNGTILRIGRGIPGQDGIATCPTRIEGSHAAVTENVEPLAITSQPGGSYSFDVCGESTD
jgi:hypothetical protein